ncbi:MAG: M20/M25/M40 family metallo-hydrolase [Candidatus Protistobacter heckmanni]|nr:M20/M25/M40 family metallo-hydrolase [Candidatus Protistobacter heckmanni]
MRAAARADAGTDLLVSRNAAELRRTVIDWRRDIHSNPELSGQEMSTAKLAAYQLRRLGMEVTTGVGGNGLVGVLHGSAAGAGKVVALRADMDALPIKEAVEMPFASKVRGVYQGQPVDIMPACGHDGHTAILMGVAEVLTRMCAQFAGTVKFLFQPAEEGEAGGAKRRPRPDIVFGLHLAAGLPTGMIGYRPGVAMASADTCHLDVFGRQSHAGGGCGPHRRLGADHPRTADHRLASARPGGESGGDHRGLDPRRQPREHHLGPSADAGHGARLQRGRARRGEIAHGEDTSAIASASGAQAEVRFDGASYGVTANDPDLTAHMQTTLSRAAYGNTLELHPIFGSEEFGEFAKEAPEPFFFVGVTPADQDMRQAAPNHSSGFTMGEKAIEVGVLALSMLAVDYLRGQ